LENIRRKFVPKFAIAFIFTLLFLLYLPIVSASGINDIPELLNDALFDGNSIYMARFTLSMLIIMMTALSLSAGGVNMIPTTGVIVCEIGFLVGVGWLHYWVLLMVALLTSALFSSRITEWLAYRI